MAIMYPDTIDETKVLSNAEIFVYKCFKEKLNDDWTVIHSVDWVGNEEVGKEQGECDFILINKKLGILILEVKGGKVFANNDIWYSINEKNIKIPIKDPIKQVNLSKFILIEKLKKAGVIDFVSTALCFPDISIDKVHLPISMDKQIVIDKDSFIDIETTLIDIMNYRMKIAHFVNHDMLESSYNKILHILMTNIKSKESLDTKNKKINMRYLQLNEDQAFCFSQLEDNKIISVKGYAGTGKTVLALHKAFSDAGKNKKVLYLCFNNLLKDKILLESSNEFDVYNIYGFAENYLKNNYYSAYEEFQSDGDYSKMIQKYLDIIKDNNSVYYDTILIDEGQDFREEWIQSIHYLMDDKSCLCIFYDEAQMLYEKYGINDVSYIKVGVKYTLKRNMRNTDEICTSSLKCIDVDKGDVILSGVKGDNPQAIFLENNLSFDEKVKKILIDLQNNNINKDDVTFLVMDAKKKIKYEKRISKFSSVQVESIRKFKGLENDIIIIPDLKSDFLDDETSKKLLYVAMSRARCLVILIFDVDNLTRKELSEFKNKVNNIIQNTK